MKGLGRGPNGRLDTRRWSVPKVTEKATGSLGCGAGGGAVKQRKAGCSLPVEAGNQFSNHSPFSCSKGPEVPTTQLPLPRETQDIIVTGVDFSSAYLFFFFNFIEASFTYNKMPTFEVFNVMSFDKFMCTYNHHCNQDIEHFHHPQKLPRAPSQLIPTLPPAPGNC